MYRQDSNFIYIDVLYYVIIFFFFGHLGYTESLITGAQTIETTVLFSKVKFEIKSKLVKTVANYLTKMG